MSPRFRSLTPDDQRSKEDEISIDMARFEAELAASIATIDSVSRRTPLPPKNVEGDELLSRFPPLDPTDFGTPVAPSPQSPERPVAPEAPAPTTEEVDLLTELRLAAEEKVAEDSAIEEENRARIERADAVMRDFYAFLIEFSGHLNKIRPAVPHVFRPIPNIELSGLRWIESSVDYRTNGGTEISPLDSISLRYTLSANDNVRVEKLPQHAVAYQDELRRIGLRFSATEKRGGRGMVEQVDFLIEREISVSLLFKVDWENEVIQLRTRNFTGLGHDVYKTNVSDFDRALLDALGRYILGRPSRLFERLIKE